METAWNWIIEAVRANRNLRRETSKTYFIAWNKPAANRVDPVGNTDPLDRRRRLTNVG